MRNHVKGSMTIFVSLLMVLFLSFCMVLIEGTRNYFIQMEAAQAMELAEFSVLSEYQRELFECYGLFFLDLDYEQNEERVAVLEKRASQYLEKNITECETLEVTAQNFRRATDEDGSAFFMQAVEQIKVESGYKLFEELVDFLDIEEREILDVGELLAENEVAAEDILTSSVNEEGLPLFDISLPKISFPSINAVTEAVFGEMTGLSQKMVDLEERILQRNLEKGDGEKESVSFTEMQLFHSYIFNYCNYYGKKEPHACKEALEYQIEYIISGETSDIKNLENIMWRIFLLRASGNYLFYHQNIEKEAEAEAKAFAVVGISGNPVLIGAVKEIFLISEAIEISLQETKSIFAGVKVPFYQGGVFANFELGYEEYLYLLLNTTGKKEKIYRCMDIVELEVRKKSGYEAFCLDHCTDCFTLTWNYTYDSLFLYVPLLQYGKYENTITKKVFYEN